MAGQTPASRRERLAIGAICVVSGLLIGLIAIGIFKPDPKSIHAPLWVIGLAGMAFALAGSSIMLGVCANAQADGSLPVTAPLLARIAQYLMGLTIVGALAAVGTWVSFGPGERSFTSTISLFGYANGGAGDETVGRIVFGFGAIAAWLFFIAVAVHGARKLLRRDAGAR
jgi:hypothetical protein